ncbi:ATP synthase subunit I [Oscillospiraceae bacterium MB08-C2-2]|nr:ATP synthase subunit I [Oscillospiraceae bacterium MB08-C2-2]
MNWLKNLSPTAVLMCKVLCGLFGVFLLVGLAVTSLVYPFEKPLPFAMGLLAGTLLSMAKVILLEKSLGRSMDMKKKQAQNYAGLQAAMRYLLTILVVVVVVFLPAVFGVFGTIIGILSLQLSAYISEYLIHKKGLSTKE